MKHLAVLLLTTALLVLACAGYTGIITGSGMAQAAGTAGAAEETVTEASASENLESGTEATAPGDSESGTEAAAQAESGTEAAAQAATDEFFDQLATGTLAVLTGTTCGTDAETFFPDAKIKYFNTIADLLAVIRAGKADAMLMDQGTTRYLQIDNPDLEIIGDRLSEISMAPAFPKTGKGQALCDQYSEYVRKLWADGTMDTIDDVWFGKDESLRTLPDYEKLPDVNGTLTLAVDASLVPFAYMKDGKIVGYDVDIAQRFCKEYGYRLKVTNMSFDGILASVQSSKSDFASCGITVTEERAESVLFGETIFTSGNVVVISNGNAAGGGGSGSGDEGGSGNTVFGGDIGESFNKTFIREDRWKLFVQGVVVTLIITVTSAILGTLLGFLVFMLCRNGNPVANGITKGAMWLVQGMPMVVLLMVLYYIIFGGVDINGLPVAIIGFTLTFGATVFGLLKVGVGAISNGQYEAAYALGYGNRQTFFRIILPQALPHILPSYKGEIVGLIKATSIVGYIAVQDLTKMGDIVRSRTYEAFFPLIAVTVIYFLLEGFLGFLVSRIQINMDPKRRSEEKILEGVTKK